MVEEHKFKVLMWMTGNWELRSSISKMWGTHSIGAAHCHWALAYFKATERLTFLLTWSYFQQKDWWRPRFKKRVVKVEFLQTDIFGRKQIPQKVPMCCVLRAGCSSHCTESETLSHSEIAKSHYKRLGVEGREKKVP